MSGAIALASGRVPTLDKDRGNPRTAAQSLRLDAFKIIYVGPEIPMENSRDSKALKNDLTRFKAPGVQK